LLDDDHTWDIEKGSKQLVVAALFIRCSVTNTDVKKVVLAKVKKHAECDLDHLMSEEIKKSAKSTIENFLHNAFCHSRFKNLHLVRFLI
jgi:hypothetical protein